MNSLLGNLVNEYYVKQFRAVAQGRSKRIASLKTKEEALQYVKEVKTKIRQAFGLEKIQRCALRPRVISVFESGGLICEKILIDSLEDYPLTCNLIRSRHAQNPSPGVLHLCGHNVTGKINVNGKALNLALAQSNMVVLTVDPLDQGERFRDPEHPISQNVRGHNLIGKRLIGCGSHFGVWRVWDAVRALDYLLTRPEVDPERVYVTGCSGGGTMTALMNAVEDRFAGAVPSCYITSWKHNVENELPVDAEQVIPRLSAAGLEMGDLLIAAAPRPIQISGEIDDMFDIRGTKEVYEEMRIIYRLLGEEDKIRLFVGPNGHGYWKEQRAACRKFLLETAGMPCPELTEEDLPVVPDEQLQVLSVPTVFDLPGVKSADQRLKEELISCEKQRQDLSAGELRLELRKCMRIAPAWELPSYRVLRPDASEEPHFARFLLEDGDLPLGVLHSADLKSRTVFPEKVFLYLPHWDYREEIAPYLQEFSQYTATAFDPMLIGELRPAGCDLIEPRFGDIYRSDYHFAACSLMLDRPISGLCTEGVIRALQTLRKGGAGEIVLIGAGQSSLTALFAAFLEPELVTRTILVNALASYKELFETPNPICPQSAIVPDFLKTADLPQIYEHTLVEFRENSKLPHLTDQVC